MTTVLAAMLVSITLSDAAPRQRGTPESAKPASPSNAWVREHSGAETHGRLVRLNSKAKEVILHVDGQERRFALADVERVQKHRSTTLRAASLGGLGAAFGVVVGFLAGLHCELQATCESGSDRMWGMTALFGGAGVAIGASLPERVTIYKGKRASPPSSRQTGITLLRFQW